MFESRTSERQLLAEMLEREFSHAVRMLKSFPAEHLDDRPLDCARSAREMAWAFVVRERLIHYLLSGRAVGIDADPPRSLHHLIEAYEEAHRETRTHLTRLTTQQWIEPLRGPVGPGLWEQGRRGELLWMTWKELVHHGAHFAVHVHQARQGDAVELARYLRRMPAPQPATV